MQKYGWLADRPKWIDRMHERQNAARCAEIIHEANQRAHEQAVAEQRERFKSYGLPRWPFPAGLPTNTFP
jgi:hypothetical protein